jgi:hypothetical protein
MSAARHLPIRLKRRYTKAETALVVIDLLRGERSNESSSI